MKYFRSCFSQAQFFARSQKCSTELPSSLKGRSTRSNHVACYIGAVVAALCVAFPNSARCQITTLVKPVLVPIAKKVVGDVVIQGSTDAVITTGISSYAEGKFSPAISDRQFDNIPKIFEYIPVTAELIDVATIAQGVWEVPMAYLAEEEERRSREAVDRMIEQVRATARDREMQYRVTRAEWFRVHLQRLIEANRNYHAATTEADKEAALAQINAVMAKAVQLAQQTGINNVDLTVLTPAQAQTIAVKFFGYDLVNRTPVGIR